MREVGEWRGERGDGGERGRWKEGRERKMKGRGGEKGEWKEEGGKNR